MTGSVIRYSSVLKRLLKTAVAIVAPQIKPKLLTVHRQLNPGLGSSFLYRRQNRAVKNPGAGFELNLGRVEVSYPS
jgi:hypothetical protein